MWRGARPEAAFRKLEAFNPQNPWKWSVGA